MKETYYFPHDYNASQDAKMLELKHKCGIEGVGIYWTIIEILHQQPDGKISTDVFKSIVSREMDDGTHEEEACLNICSTMIATGLIQADEKHVWSNRVFQNQAHRKILSEAGRIGGKASAHKRVRTIVQRHPETSLKHIKERKGKERKRKEIIKETIEGPSAALKASLDQVYKKGLNIYALINQLKKERGWTPDKSFPEDVLLRVCEAYLKDPEHVNKSPWAWFKKTLNITCDNWQAAQEIEKGRFFKEQPVFITIESLLTRIDKRW